MKLHTHDKFSPRLRARLTVIAVALIAFAATAQAEPAMWVIRDKDSTIYLIGTVHLLRHGTDWLSPRIKKALDGSNELWLEIADPDNQLAALPLIQKYGFDREHPLSAQLSAAQKEKFDKIATTYDLPQAVFEPMRPWLAALMVAVIPLQKAGYDPNAGVDLFLKKQADARGEKVRGFETLEEQFRFFASLSPADQIEFFEQTLDETDEGIALNEKLATAWLQGKTELINEMLSDEMKTKSPKLYEKLLVQRNVHWSERIAKILDGAGVQTIAVGAGHLAGPDSVQAQLAKRGIKVKSY